MPLSPHHLWQNSWCCICNAEGAIFQSTDSKESFFSILGPFSPLASGKLFFEEVVDAIGRVIETETEHRAKKVRTRMNKYVAKYRK